MTRTGDVARPASIYGFIRTTRTRPQQDVSAGMDLLLVLIAAEANVAAATEVRRIMEHFPDSRVYGPADGDDTGLRTCRRGASDDCRCHFTYR